jgi:prophage regulatory protein
MDNNIYLRLPQILDLIPIGKSTWYSWVKKGIAPQPIRFGLRCSMWRHTDIMEFIEEYANKREAV